MTNINATIDNILGLLEEQKELLGPTKQQIVKAATHYAFVQDDSVALSGPMGSLRVFPDGKTSEVDAEPGMPAYPGYVARFHLECAKGIALEYLTQ